jgi:hypothetical protein
MDFMYSIFFGAGVAAFVYSKVGRRVGYSNTSNIAILVGAIFIICTIIFFTIIKTVTGK